MNKRGIFSLAKSALNARVERAELEIRERELRLTKQSTEAVLELQERETQVEKQKQEQEIRAEKLRFVRRRVAMLSSAWEGAETDRLRGDKWMTSKLSANDNLERETETLVERAESLYRNDCYAASAINGRAKNVIGKGIGYQSRVVAVKGLISEARAKRINQQKESVFKRWAKIERLHHKQKMAEICKAIYGESLVVMSDEGAADKPIPLHIQVILPRRLETPPELESDPDVRMGIRFKPGTLIPAKYYIRKTDPNDSKEVNFEYDEIDASRVCHDFEETFPGQIRGVPWLSPVMNKLKDIKDFAEAHLITEQTAACFSGFVTTKSDDDNHEIAEGRAFATDAYGNPLEGIEPGSLNYINDDQSITFADPSRPGGTLAPFVEFHLHGVAAGLSYPFELLVKQYDNSYSGGRLSLLDGFNSFRCWQGELIENTWQKVSNRFTDECVIVGAIDVEPDEYIIDREFFRKDEWLPRGWPWIAPKDDVEATLKAREGGLTTDTEALALVGQDFEETQQTLLREQITKLEIAAKVEEKRQELAAKFKNNNFGLTEDQIKQKQQEKEVLNEPVNA